MQTPGLEPKLQTCIRKYFAKQDWNELASSLGITLKAVQYNLNPALGRDVTYNFIGLIAVFYPAAWMTIIKTFVERR
jgi:hypothetical protein